MTEIIHADKYPADAEQEHAQTEQTAKHKSLSGCGLPPQGKQHGQ